MYTPVEKPQDPVTHRELLKISEEFIAVRRMELFVTAPEKPSEGEFCLCDGVHWNPLGDGVKRPVWYDTVANLWKAF